MILTELSKFPRGGYQYREPSINWVAPDPSIGLVEVTKQLMQARAQNPASGLNPSYQACYDAIRRFTCARLNNDPLWCSPEKGEAIAAPVNHSQPTRRGGCCGG